MKNEIKAGDWVTLKSFVHKTNWEKVGYVQWTRGNYAAVRWVENLESQSTPDWSRLPVTRREISELEAFSRPEKRDFTRKDSSEDCEKTSPRTEDVE